jgi:hypothetical protein
LYLNFYGPGTVVVPLTQDASQAASQDGMLTLTQTTEYPRQGAVAIDVGLAQDTRFVLHLRIPSWSQDTQVRINGTPVESVSAGSYLPLARTWRNGDRIEIELDLGLHFWVGERECAGKVSLYRGPILLAYDQRYNEVDPADIPQLDLRDLAYTEMTWDQPLAPWLLLRFQSPDGAPLFLCDFANAGMVGTEYRSWLPVAEDVAENVAMASLQNKPVWTARPR